MEVGSAFLPDEILVNILKRLPVKSLIRFQCVSKHWKNLVKSPCFIEDHLHHSTHQYPSLLVQWGRCRNFTFQLTKLDCDMQELEVQNAPLIDSFPSVRIVGSTNGLLCLKVVDESRSLCSILLWNPATREVRPISNFKGMCFVGVGFSPIVNDYKVVVIYVLNIKSEQVSRVQVFSLSAKSWKEVGFGNLEGIGIVRSTAVSANGALFWIGFKEDEDFREYLIVSFDIANEVFTLIPMPELPFSRKKKLTVYENNLAIICEKMNKSDENFGICFKLWVREESIGAFGMRWSWTNKYTSSSCGLLRLDPVTIWRNEIVCKYEGGCVEYESDYEESVDEFEDEYVESEDESEESEDEYEESESESESEYEEYEGEYEVNESEYEDYEGEYEVNEFEYEEYEGEYEVNESEYEEPGGEYEVNESEYEESGGEYEESGSEFEEYESECEEFESECGECESEYEYEESEDEYDESEDESEYDYEEENEYLAHGNKIALYMFNPTAHEFEVRVMLRFGYENEIFNYVESLVSIGNVHIGAV